MVAEVKALNAKNFCLIISDMMYYDLQNVGERSAY